MRSTRVIDLLYAMNASQLLDMFDNPDETSEAQIRNMSEEEILSLKCACAYLSGLIDNEILVRESIKKESRCKKEKDCKANRTVLADYPGANWYESSRYAARYHIGNGQFVWFCQDCGSRIDCESNGCNHCGYGKIEGYAE